MSALPVLQLKDLSRSIAGKVVVDHIHLEVFPGELIALLGHSGAGKSSLLRMINRLDEPSTGTVYFKGQDYRDIPPQKLRQQIGMMMQAAHLFPGTVATNLRLGPEHRGETLSDQAIEALLTQVGLAGFDARDVMNLSGGEAQRVSLARTLANAPQVLLLDEPTSALDPRTGREIEALLQQILKDFQLTTLMITHNPEQALRIAQRAIVMQSGRVVYDGSVKEALYVESTLF